MDLNKYANDLENISNSSNLLEYAKINFQSKTGVISLSKKNEDGTYSNVEVPKNKRISLYVVDCTTTYVDKEGVTHPITIKGSEDSKKDGFKIQFRDQNKIFDFYKDFEKLFIKKMINQLLNCDLSKPVSFLFAFDKSQKPFLLVQQKNAEGEIVNIKGKYSKEEMPVAEPLVNKAGKPHLDTRGMPTYDYTETFDYIKNNLIEELKVKVETEKRTDWTEYATPVAEEQLENPIPEQEDYEIDADIIYGNLPLSHFED